MLARGVVNGLHVPDGSPSYFNPPVHPLSAHYFDQNVLSNYASKIAPPSATAVFRISRKPMSDWLRMNSIFDIFFIGACYENDCTIAIWGFVNNRAMPTFRRWSWTQPFPSRLTQSSGSDKFYTLLGFESIRIDEDSLLSEYPSVYLKYGVECGGDLRFKIHFKLSADWCRARQVLY